MRHVVVMLPFLLSACDDLPLGSRPGQGAQSNSAASETVESEVTTVTSAEAAAAPVVWQGAKQTVAALGDPTVPGLWMETPLVSQERTGRVTVRKTGVTAVVTLLPLGGDETSGSRLSLEAMRALLAPIDELIELDVYSS